MICKSCGTENHETANFCHECGKKLREVCDCRFKKEPYNCGQDQCPGYRLFLMELLKARSAASESHSQSQSGKTEDPQQQGFQGT